MDLARILLAVGGGGFLGAIARWSLGRWILSLQGPLTASSFPWPTLTVNLLGTLVAGCLAGYWRSHAVPAYVPALLMTGFLGSFTTFSMFSLDVVGLGVSGAKGALTAYLLASVGGCIAAAVAGMSIGNAWANR